MFDKSIANTIKPLLDSIARWLSRCGMRADMITWAGFVLGLLSAGLIALGYHVAGLGFILLSRLFDGLDGALARQTTATDRGGFLDISCDFIFYASVPLAFAIHNPQVNGLAAAVLLFSFIGTSTSFLAFASLAAKHKMTTEGKSIYFLGGLTESFETLLVFCCMCLYPLRFTTIAYCFAALCMVTTVERMYQGWRQLSGK
jgi:phosphatidylglycerophosphate synthase